MAFPGKDLLVNQSQRLDSSWNVPKQTRDLGDAAFRAAYRSAAEWILTHEQACVYVLFVVCHPHAMPPHHTIPHHATSCHAMPCHAMPCHRSHMPCHAMPCHAMPCHAMALTCHAMPPPCHATRSSPCHHMPHPHSFYPYFHWQVFTYLKNTYVPLLSTPVESHDLVAPTAAAAIAPNLSSSAPPSGLDVLSAACHSHQDDSHSVASEPSSS